MVQSRSRNSSRSTHFAVIGGGVIGAASAVRLRQAGHDVTLVDPGDEEGRTSFGNAGQVVIDAAEPLASWHNVWTAPGRLFAFGGPLDFCLSDIDLWLPWSFRYLAACNPDRFKRGTKALRGLLERAVPEWKDLTASIGRPDLVEESGHFQLWESETSARRGLAAMSNADVGPARWRAITPQERESLAGRFAGQVKGGVFFENTVRLRDPGETVRALWKGLTDLGGKTVTGHVARLQATDDGVTLTMDDGSTLEADQVLVAGGARSAALMADLGIRAPLVAERGYHLRFDDPHWPRTLPAILFEDRWIYLSSFDSGVRVTGFTEIGRPDTPSDPRKWALLERHLRELGVQVPETVHRWRGSRPTLPDFLPAIGRLNPRVLYAFGHQHIGMTLAAATAQAVAELTSANTTPQRLTAFDLRRFG
ncbi:MAG TPA: FAD-dependent oxidoreductase [Caulobacteraceae bacterium]|nr:FAD-dependent oxidoreductase [Caulobacteraceae bacterium]